MRILRLGVVRAVLLVAFGISGSAQVVGRAYVDRASGVSFSYPANWLLNADDDAATAKLRIVGEGQPVAVVQLEGNFADDGPFKGTDFEASAFAFVVTPRQSAKACFAALDPIAGDEQKPIAITWNGALARKLIAKYEVAGTEDSHQILATYRQGQCYLFETVIVSKSVDSVEKPLNLARWKVIKGQVAGVLQSVHLGRAVGNKPVM